MNCAMQFLLRYNRIPAVFTSTFHRGIPLVKEGAKSSLLKGSASYISIGTLLTAVSYPCPQKSISNTPQLRQEINNPSWDIFYERVDFNVWESYPDQAKAIMRAFNACMWNYTAEHPKATPKSMYEDLMAGRIDPKPHPTIAAQIINALTYDE